MCTTKTETGARHDSWKQVLLILCTHRKCQTCIISDTFQLLQTVLLRKSLISTVVRHIVDCKEFWQVCVMIRINSWVCIVLFSTIGQLNKTDMASLLSQGLKLQLTLTTHQSLAKLLLHYLLRIIIIISLATTLNGEFRFIKNLVKFMCQEFEVSKVTPAHNLARMCNQLKRQLVHEIYIIIIHALKKGPCVASQCV